MGTKGEGLPEFEAEFDRLFARAFSVARRLTGNAAAAEDIGSRHHSPTMSGNCRDISWTVGPNSLRM